MIFRSFLQKSRCPRHIRPNQDYPVIAEVKNYICTNKTSIDMQLCAVHRWFSKLFIFEARFLLTPSSLWWPNRCKRISSSSRFGWYHAQFLTRKWLLYRQQATDRWTSSTHRLSNLLGSLSALYLGSFDSVEFGYWYSLPYRPFIILYDPYSGRHIICHILYVTYIKHFFDSKLPICDFWIVYWNSRVY